MNHSLPASTISNTNFNTTSAQYSLATLQYKIVTLLKQNREGLTISEIERQIQFKIDNDILQKLRNNQHLQYLPEQEKLVFKFKYNIFSKDDLIQYLQQPPNALIIDDDVRIGYPNIDKDVQVCRENPRKTTFFFVFFSYSFLNCVFVCFFDCKALRQEYKVLCVQHISSKQQVVYWNPIPPPLELLPVSTLPDEIKARWHRIEPIDIVEIRRVLQANGMPLSCLACNTIPQVATSDDHSSLSNERSKRGCGRSKRLRGLRQHIDNPELAALAERVQLYNATTTTTSNSLVIDDADTMKVINGDPSSTLPITSIRNNITMTENDNRARYLHHNVDADPEEFERVVQVLCATAYLFYNDEVALVLHMFLDQKIQYEMDLVNTLLLPQRQVSSILLSLMNHHILRRTICQTKAVIKLQRTLNVWSLDLDRAIDAINYHLLQMESQLSDEIKQKQDQILLCPVCKIYYRTIDISTLDNPAPNVYCCGNCLQHTKLETVDNSLEIHTKQQLLIRMTQLLKPLKTTLQSLTASSATEKNSSRESFRMNVPTSQPQKQKMPSIRSAREERSRKSSTHLNKHTTTTQSSVSSTVPQTFVTPVPPSSLPTTQSSSTLPTLSNDKDSSIPTNANSSSSQVPNAVLSAPVSFHTQPLYFGTECDVYLPIITELNEWERELGVQLAKELLDSIADFESIINARVFKYIITRHSLYIAYKRSFRAAEILRLLRTLARNPIPRQLHELISNEENYIHYYRTVLILREGSFFVQSMELSVIRALLQDPRIRKLAAHPDQILRVYQTNLPNSSLPNKTELVQDTTNLNNEQKEAIPQYAFEILPGTTEAVKKYSFEAGYPIIDEFDFVADLSLNIQ
jgi:transcription initiation factor IIE alpha subunit